MRSRRIGRALKEKQRAWEDRTCTLVLPPWPTDHCKLPALVSNFLVISFDLQGSVERAGEMAYKGLA